MIGDRTVQAFLDDLATKGATPGGGSAAAVMGAMGAALVSMVCRLTIGRKGYESVDAELRAVLADAEQSRARLGEMVRLDVDAVESVLRAYRLPKDTPAAVAARSEAIQAALRVATDVPVDCARTGAAVIALARTAAEKGSRTAVSDAGAGALAAQAALRSAALNVYANGALMTDRAYADTRAREMDALLAEGAAHVEEIWRLLTGRG